VSLINKHLLSTHARGGRTVVAETVGKWLEVLKSCGIRLLLSRISATRLERHLLAGCLLNSSATSEHNQICQGNLLTVGGRAVELLLHTLKSTQDLVQLVWAVDLPPVLRCQPDASTVGTTTLVSVTEGRGGCPCDENQARNIHVGCQDILLQLLNVAVIHQLMVDCRRWVLPNGHLRWDLWTQPSSARAHVTVQKLEPSASFLKASE